MNAKASRPSSGIRLWGWPIALGVISLAGLFCALFSDGAGDVISWIMLGYLVAVCAWFGVFTHRVRRS
jgi:hypothetical protein